MFGSGHREFEVIKFLPFSTLHFARYCGFRNQNLESWFGSWKLETEGKLYFLLKFLKFET